MTPRRRWFRGDGPPPPGVKPVLRLGQRVTVKPGVRGLGGLSGAIKWIDYERIGRKPANHFDLVLPYGVDLTVETGGLRFFAADELRPQKAPAPPPPEPPDDA